MELTLGAFSRLRYQRQLYLVLTRGVYLGCRQCHSGGLHLYHLPITRTGLFVELRYNAALDAIRIARSFTEAAALADYLSLVQLPAGLA